MSIKIYYFSGTGNSFIVARDIAKKVDADILSIPKILDSDRIHIDADVLGIVFPSYLAPLSGLPLIVERFVKKITNIDTLRIFAVCTCGGYECVNANPSLHRLRKIIKSCGGKLTEEYSLRLPMNNLDYDHIPIPITRNQEIIIDRSKIKVNDICNRIMNRRGTKYGLMQNLFYTFMSPLFRMMQKPIINTLREKAKEPVKTKLQYFELMPLTDRSIIVDDKCKGCGICTRVCPVKNIKLVSSMPEFQHRCEMCFACDEWCPSDAIHHWSRSNGIKYHHPEVKLSDML